MEALEKALNEINCKLTDISKQLEQNSNKEHLKNSWIDAQEVMQILYITQRTLQT